MTGVERIGGEDEMVWQGDWEDAGKGRRLRRQ